MGVMESDWVLNARVDENGQWLVLTRAYFLGPVVTQRSVDIKMLAMAVDPIGMLANEDQIAHDTLRATE